MVIVILVICVVIIHDMVLSVFIVVVLIVQVPIPALPNKANKKHLLKKNVILCKFVLMVFPDTPTIFSIERGLYRQHKMRGETKVKRELMFCCTYLTATDVIECLRCLLDLT